jgi:DNA-nicking Smr family endonuclease
MSEDQEKPDDKRFVQEAFKDVEPLADNRREPFRRRLPPRPLRLPVGDEAQARDHYSEHEIETGEVLDFARPGVQQRLMHDLRRGYLEIGAELDLLGLTVRHAREHLDHFLSACQAREIRCARIIHGKGYGSAGRQPILKQKLNLWLRQHEEVLAFTSAPRHDGGTGAAYVLLRNPAKRRRRPRK